MKDKVRGMKERKQNCRLHLVAVLALIGLLLANVGLILLPNRFVRLDMTKAKTYTLADESKTFLQNMTEEVTLYAIYGDERDQKFEYFLENMAEEGKTLNLEWLPFDKSSTLFDRAGVDPSDREGLKSLPYCLIMESSKRLEMVDYYSLFYYENDNTTLMSFLGLTENTMSYRDYQQYYYQLYQYSLQNSQYEQYLYALSNDSTLYFRGEGVICATLEYVLADRIPTQYVITGHGEATVEETILERLLSLYGESYIPLTLTEGGRIPYDASAVLIPTPTVDYSVWETELLRAYLEQGGTVVLVSDDKLFAMPNLTALLASYGLSATTDIICVEKEVTEDDGVTVEKIITSEVEVKVHADHDALAGAMGESSLAPVITDGNAIVFAENGDDSLIHTSLLTTSEGAFLQGKSETNASYTLAATAENNKGARLVWFTGGGSFGLSNKNAAVGDVSVFNNFCLYLTMQWSGLTYETTLTPAKASVYQSSYLESNAGTTVAFGIFGVILLPATVILTGVVIGYRRKKA